MASSDMPMTAFMGVRISWLILAKKSLLDLEAASALLAKFDMVSMRFWSCSIKNFRVICCRHALKRNVFWAKNRIVVMAKVLSVSFVA